jgi:hypothetical protein
MDRKRNSEKPQPEERPIEPEMPKGLDEEKSARAAEVQRRTRQDANPDWDR